MTLKLQDQLRMFDLLPDELLMKIFECLIEAHAPLRLVSRNFRRIYDNFTYKMSITIFPALSEWPAEDLKYQLIPLSNVLYFNIKPLVAQYVAELDLVTDTNLRQHSIQLIIFLQSIDLEACLKLSNFLLKLGIVNWQDIGILLLSAGSCLVFGILLLSAGSCLVSWINNNRT